MAVDLERLVVQLSADVKKYENALNRAWGITNRQAKNVENRFAKMNKGVSMSFLSLGKTLTGVLAGSAFIRGAIKFSDAATRIDNSLKVAGLSGEELEKVYNRLRESAVRNAAPIEALTELYGRAALVQKELGISGEELLNFTDKIAVALRVSGKSAAESSGALLQLSQALGSGVVRAEEFNSILEGALPIAQAAAAGLKEAGGSVAKLRQLVVDGKVSSEAFFRAFEAGAPILEDKVAGATFTVAQATGNLMTSLIDVAREFNTSTGASERFAGGINKAATAIADFDVSGFIAEIQRAYGAIDQFMDRMGNAEIFEAWLRLFDLIDDEGNVVNLDTKEANDKVTALEREVQMLQERIALNTELGFDNTEAIARLNEVSATLARVRAEAANMQPLADLPGFVQPGGGGSTRGRYKPKAAVNAVSLADFAAPDGKGRKGGRSKKDSWQREIEQIKERTEALQAETAALSTINPLIEDYGYTLEKARAKQDLLTAAKRAGIAVTPDLEAEIEKLAEGYAQASVEAEKLAEAQDKARQTAEEMRDLGKDVMGGFIKDLVDGKSAADALASALGKIADKLLDMAMNDLWGNGSGGGILGALFDGLFGGGGGSSDPWGGLRATGGPVQAGKAYIVGEKQPELFVPNQSGTIVPQVPVMPTIQASGAGSSVVVNFNPVIDNRGASIEAVARTQQQLDKLKAQLPSIVTQSVRQANKSNVKF